jgi:GNAT superfamily N-acetyltransferase
MKIHIREAVREDASILIEFNRAMARETEGRELSMDVIGPGVSSLFDHPEYGFYLVAEVDGIIAGSLMITFEWSDWRNGLFWWVQSVYVRSQFRRKGIYRALYTDVKKKAHAKPGICGCRLYVEKDNRIAQTTYSDLGMNETHYVMFEEIFRRLE